MDANLTPDEVALKTAKAFHTAGAIDMCNAMIHSVKSSFTKDTFTRDEVIQLLEFAKTIAEETD